MASIYARWIRAGRMTLEDVPLRWQEAVQTLLADPESGVKTP